MIFIEGNIAAGKSTLGAALAEHVGFTFWEEPVEAWREWGILRAYYTDPVRWAFTMQIAALTTRAAILKKAMQAEHGLRGGARHLFVERSLLTDKHVFARHGIAHGNIAWEEEAVYRAAWRQAAALMPAEPTIVYLRTPAEECLERIHLRGRPEEQSIPLSYLEELERLHDEWLSERDCATAVVISGAQTVGQEVDAFLAWRDKYGV